MYLFPDSWVFSNISNMKEWIKSFLKLKLFLKFTKIIVYNSQIKQKGD
jgi:hypothetical protein